MFSTTFTAEVTDKIVDFTKLDLKPLCTIDSIGFQRFLGFVEPGYKIPSLTHVKTMFQRSMRSL